MSGTVHGGLRQYPPIPVAFLELLGLDETNAGLRWIDEGGGIFVLNNRSGIIPPIPSPHLLKPPEDKEMVVETPSRDIVTEFDLQDACQLPPLCNHMKATVRRITMRKV